MEKMSIYELGRSVPPEAQKPFSNGSFSGTDINPMWRIKKLTEIFGPAGIGWYTEVISERAETYGSTVMAIVDINLYVKTEEGWSKPIFGTGGNQLVSETRSGIKPSDEGYKKAYTDALSIACKALGIGADIWFSKDVNNDPTMKYASQTKPKAVKKATPEQIAIIGRAYNNSDLKKLLDYFGVSALEEMSEDDAAAWIKRYKLQ